jgi:hypothetical protein
MAMMEALVEVTPGSELDRLLAEANGAPIILIHNGRRYRLAPEDGQADIWAGYDPEAVRKALAETAGAWGGVDAEALIEDIRAQRGHRCRRARE